MSSQLSPSANRNTQAATVIGAGLAGTLMAVFLARREIEVHVFERRADLRRVELDAGRSINLALADRGIHALRTAGIFDDVAPLLIPMRGRMLHDPRGALSFVPYGQRPHELNYSVSRPGLNAVLLDHLEQRYGVSVQFETACLGADFAAGRLCMQLERAKREFDWPLEHVLAADGAGSPVRQALVAATGARCSEDWLEHGYKELTLPAGRDGRHQIEREALHIWPRGGFMLIALPNLDGSFTVTLFLPLEGDPGFSGLADATAIERLFAREFPDALELMPGLAGEFLTNPTGRMGTVRCERWVVGDQAALLGDAAHAVVPFHGQGMNCAFEDCVALDALLASHEDWVQAFAAYEVLRRPDADAIADMALENYVEMRDTVRDPGFQLRKLLAFELERRLPERFIPRYSMVMFHHEIPYAEAFARGQIQESLLAELTRGVRSLEEVDLAHATALVMERLPPLSVAQ